MTEHDCGTCRFGGYTEPSPICEHCTGYLGRDDGSYTEWQPDEFTNAAGETA